MLEKSSFGRREIGAAAFTGVGATHIRPQDLLQQSGRFTAQSHQRIVAKLQSAFLASVYLLNVKIVKKFLLKLLLLPLTYMAALVQGAD